MKTKGKALPSTLIPGQMQRPDEDESPHQSTSRELQIVFPKQQRANSGFKLPDDWIVEERPRSNISYYGTIDKYYHEPGTGRRFRSLLAVERYLNGEENSTYSPKLLTSGTEIIKLEEPHQKRETQIVVSPVRSTSPIRLPDDWVIEEKPRRSGKRHTDKYYYEPGTGRRFRSMISVQRYLTELEETTATPNASKPRCQYIPSYDYIYGSQEKITSDENLPLKDIQKYLTETKQNTNTPKPSKSCGPRKKSYGSRKKSHGSRKKSVSREKVKTSMFNSTCLPAKVNWVLNGPGGNIWSPFVGDSMVPDSVQKEWSEIFVSIVHD